MTEGDPRADQLATLLSALDKMPVFDGLTYRGYGARLDALRSRTVVSGILVATSRDPRVATANFATGGVYAVISTRGRDLSPATGRSQEAEVVFGPGSLFLPLELLDVDGLQVAMVEELDPDRDPTVPPAHTLEDLRAQAASEVRAARSRADVDIATDRFVGPLS